MGFLSRWRIHKTPAAHASIEVSEKNGVRSLHLGSATVQSAMRVAAPDELLLSYTRCMMGVLLFHPRPVRFLMVGLGGGSLAKYVYRHLPQACVTAVEINPQIAAVARSHFGVPQDDARFKVEVAEGGAYVAAHPAGADVLMVDAFDGVSIAEPLSTGEFYRHAVAALGGEGIMAVNLWGSDPRFDEHLRRISAAFDGRVLCLPAEGRSNIVVFGFRKSQGNPRWEDLRSRARKLEERYRVEFVQQVAALRKMNPHDDKRLMI